MGKGLTLFPMDGQMPSTKLPLQEGKAEGDLPLQGYLEYLGYQGYLLVTRGEDT
jgi:hypothetical protein